MRPPHIHLASKVSLVLAYNAFNSSAKVILDIFFEFYRDDIMASNFSRIVKRIF